MVTFVFYCLEMSTKKEIIENVAALKIQGMLLAIQTSGSGATAALVFKKNSLQDTFEFCIKMHSRAANLQKKNPINQLYKSSCNKGL